MSLRVNIHSSNIFSHYLIMVNAILLPHFPHQLCGRTVRVDHVENYRLPKHLAEKEQDELQRKASGVVGDATADFSAAAVVDKETGNSNYYHGQELVNEYSLQQGQDLFAPRVIKATNKNESVTPTLPLSNNSNGSMNDDLKHQRKREMKHQRRIEKETRKRERNSKRMEREERRRQRRSRNIRNDKDGDDDDDILLERHSRKSHSAKSKIHKDDESSYSSSEEAKEREKKEHPKDRKKGSRRKHDKVVHGR